MKKNTNCHEVFLLATQILFGSSNKALNHNTRFDNSCIKSEKETLCNYDVYTLPSVKFSMHTVFKVTEFNTTWHGM